jgi:hypothetical protein
MAKVARSTVARRAWRRSPSAWPSRALSADDAAGLLIETAERTLFA